MSKSGRVDANMSGQGRQHKKGKNKGDITKLKVLPVRKDPDTLTLARELPEPLDNMAPACMTIYAVPASGKSTWVSNLLLNDNMLRDIFEGGIYYISPTCFSDETSRFLTEEADFVSDEYDDAIIDQIVDYQMGIPKKDRLPICIVLDDILGLIKNASTINHLSSRYRHLRATIITVSQIYKGLPPAMRANASHSVIFNNPSEIQLKQIAEGHSQFGGEDNFMALYYEITKEPYAFMLCDHRNMEVWRNFDEMVWSKNDSNYQDVKIQKLNDKTGEKKISDNNIKKDE